MLGWFSDFIHDFRMHAFFLISGFFAAFQLSRKPCGDWLGARMVRLGVPLLAAALLLNPLQMLGLAVSETGGWGTDGTALWLARLGRFGEPWVAHLWFLVVLILYSLGLAAIWAMLPARGESPPARRLGRAGTALMLAATAAAFVVWRLGTATVARLTDEGLCLAEGALRLDYALFYLPYFVLGAVLERNRDLLARFGAWGRFAAPFGIGAFVAAQMLWRQPGLETLVLSRALQGLSSFLLCAALFHLLMRHFDGLGQKLRGIAAAAFTIYLFHQPMVVWLGLLFGGVGLPPMLEFTAITATITLAAYAIHVRLIAPYPMLSFLFNGVVPKRRPPITGAVG